MKAKLVTAAYLLWALAFLPAAALAVALAGVPYFLAVYLFHWVSAISAIAGLCFYAALWNLCTEFFVNRFPAYDGPLPCFLGLFPLAAFFGGVCYLFWCSGWMVHAAPRDYLLWLGLAAVFAAAFRLVPFVREARESVRSQLPGLLSYPKDLRMIYRILRRHYADALSEALLKKLPWPEERELLVQKAQNGSKTALEKLPWPEEAETLRSIARSDSHSSFRRAALDKLPFPAERETLEQAALKDENTSNRMAVLSRLPYPDARETLVMAAKKGMDVALKKLPYPEERETLVMAAKKGEDVALEKLPWPEEADRLRSFARSSRFSSYRRAALLDKLPWPEERKTLEQAALQDEDSDIRMKVLSRLPYPDARKTLEQAALKDPHPKIRKQLLTSLPYPEAGAALTQAALHDESADNRETALARLTYPADRKALVQAALFDVWSCSSVARNKLPYPDKDDPCKLFEAACDDYQRTEGTMAVIDFCEPVIQRFDGVPNHNPVLPLAVLRLRALYDSTRSPKRVLEGEIHGDYERHSDYWDCQMDINYVVISDDSSSEMVHTDATLPNYSIFDPENN